MPPRPNSRRAGNQQAGDQQADEAALNLSPAMRELIRTSIAAGVEAGLRAHRNARQSPPVEPRVKDYVISNFDTLDNNCSPAELRAWRDTYRMAKAAMPNQLRTSINRVAFMKDHMSTIAKGRWESKCQSESLASASTERPVTYEELHDNDDALYEWVEELQRDPGNVNQSYSVQLLNARQGDNQTPISFDTDLENLELAQGTQLVTDDERANMFHIRLRPWLIRQIQQNYMATGLPKSRNAMVTSAQRIWDQTPSRQRQKLEAEFPMVSPPSNFSLQGRSSNQSSSRDRDRDRNQQLRTSSDSTRSQTSDSQSRRTGQPSQNRGRGNRPSWMSDRKPNLPDAKGEPTTCHNCGSIWHWASDCPSNVQGSQGIGRTGRPSENQDPRTFPNDVPPLRGPRTTKAVTGKRKRGSNSITPSESGHSSDGASDHGGRSGRDRDVDHEDD